MQKANIMVDTTKCTGCLSCQLICSLEYAGAFNTEKARIRIDYDIEHGGSGRELTLPVWTTFCDKPGKAYIEHGRKATEITFTDDCIAGCSLCTRYCEYKAITKK